MVACSPRALACGAPRCRPPPYRATLPPPQSTSARAPCQLRSSARGGSQWACLASCCTLAARAPRRTAKLASFWTVRESGEPPLLPQGRLASAAAGAGLLSSAAPGSPTLPAAAARPAAGVSRVQWSIKGQKNLLVMLAPEQKALNHCPPGSTTSEQGPGGGAAHWACSSHEASSPGAISLPARCLAHRPPSRSLPAACDYWKLLPFAYKGTACYFHTCSGSFTKPADRK